MLREPGSPGEPGSCLSTLGLTLSAGVPILMANTRSSTSATAEARPVLTARQQEIWNYLVEYVDRQGYPPTVREIGEHVGLASPSTVHAHLANLERAGLLRRDPTKPRALELIGRERREPGTAAATEALDVTRLPLV